MSPRFATRAELRRTAASSRRRTAPASLARGPARRGPRTLEQPQPATKVHRILRRVERPCSALTLRIEVAHAIGVAVLATARTLTDFNATQLPLARSFVLAHQGHPAARFSRGVCAEHPNATAPPSL
jgi:hypothetical protein